MNRMIAKVKKVMCVMAAAGLCLGLLTGCGDGIKKGTSESVITKTDTALQLYADIEKMVQDHALMADENFTAMKSKLTEMSARIKEKIADMTEEDIEDWDSVEHVYLLMSIEKSFGIEMLDAMEKPGSIGKLIDIIEERTRNQ